MFGKVESKPSMAYLKVSGLVIKSEKPLIPTTDPTIQGTPPMAYLKNLAI